MGAIVRAIDVGFGNTKFVTESGPRGIRCSHFPSLVFINHGERSQIDDIGGKRRTVCVPVGGLFFEVGPEVELAAERYRAREFHENYTEKEEYRALVAGALHYMQVETVDLLVLGLPVSQYLAKRTALEKAMTGTFAVSRKKKVTVGKVLVLAQPQGALMDYASREDKTAAGGTSLVMDAGFRTFDWLVTRKGKVLSKMSGSANRGVLEILLPMANSIGAQIGEQITHLEAIDQAYRGNKILRVYQRDINLAQFDRQAEKVADQAVSTVIQSMDHTYDVEHIILVGGGAPLYRKAIRRHFKSHTIHEVEDSRAANVRGFQLIGEQYVRERPELFGGPDTFSEVGGTKEMLA